MELMGIRQWTSEEYKVFTPIGLLIFLWGLLYMRLRGAIWLLRGWVHGILGFLLSLLDFGGFHERGYRKCGIKVRLFKADKDFAPQITHTPPLKSPQHPSNLKKPAPHPLISLFLAFSLPQSNTPSS